MNPPPGSLRAWVLAARPATLTAAFVPVAVGTAVAHATKGARLGPALAALFGAFMIQIATNFANDVFDHEKGADTSERLGPTRAVQAGLLTARQVRGGMLATILLAVLAGLYLARVGGWPIVVIGVLSVLSGLAYTGGPYPLGYHGLGDVFVFLFFGLVAVCATFYVQTGTVTVEALIAAVAIGALATNILVVNNYRDVETDRVAGKRTLVVRFGRQTARAQFAFDHAIALTAPIFLAARGVAALAMLWLPLAALAAIAVGQFVLLKRAETPRDFFRLLSQTGLYLAGFAVVLSVWIVLGK